MVFHGDYEEALDNWESRNNQCPKDIKVGDLVQLTSKWLGVSPHPVGVVIDVYKITHEQSRESYWCCKVYMEGKEWSLPVSDFELVKKGNKD